MMSSQLLLLIAITTVLGIDSVERCVGCNTIPTKATPDTPGPASCSNNCFLQEQSKPETFTSWSKLGPVLQFDDAGIYYEPSEMLPFDQVAFIPQPFYILNPTYEVDPRISRSATKLDDDTDITVSNKHVPKNKHHKQQKHRKKEENGHKQLERQLKNIPFYLDVDLKEPRTESRANPDVENHLENLKLAEEYLSICLDLHVLEFYRKNDSTFKNLKDVWDVQKFHYYANLSDLDLEYEIRNKCNHSLNIVEKSLNEIKNTWPKNNDISFSTTQAFPIMAGNADKNNPTIHTDLISNKTSENTIYALVNFTFTDQTTTDLTILDSTASRNILMKPNMLQDTVFRSVNPTNNAENQLQFPLISPVDQIKFDLTTTSSDTLAESTNITGETQEAIAKESSTKDDLHLNSSYELGYKDINGKTALSSYTNSKIYFIPMMKRTLNIEAKDVPIVHDVTTPDLNENMTEAETGILLNENNSGAFTTTSTLYTENGNTFSEADIQVSQIVTKEYPNDTATSSIEGIENSFLNNYKLMNKDMSTVSIFSDNARSTGNSLEITTNNNKIINAEITFPSVEPSPGDDFTGNLYFLYRNQSVPARFIQHSDGKINVGLDGYSLCDTIHAVTVKSVLLNVLCNCVKFNNCTNNSS